MTYFRPAFLIGRFIVLGSLLLSSARCNTCDTERNGTYRGPKDAVVVVKDGVVTTMELTYGGNMGLALTGGTIKREGMFEIIDNSFTVPTQGPRIKGTFDGCGEIAGSWQDGQVNGTWSAKK